jgi:hypothetical protein
VIELANIFAKFFELLPVQRHQLADDGVDNALILWRPGHRTARFAVRPAGRVVLES